MARESRMDRLKRPAYCGASRFIDPLPAASTTIMPRAVAVRVASKSACQNSSGTNSNCPQLQEQLCPLLGPGACCSIRITSPGARAPAALLTAVGTPALKKPAVTTDDTP